MKTVTMKFWVPGCETLAEGRARAYAIASTFFESAPEDIEMDIWVVQSVIERRYDMTVVAWRRK